MAATHEEREKIESWEQAVKERYGEIIQEVPAAIHGILLDTKLPVAPPFSPAQLPGIIKMAEKWSGFHFKPYKDQLRDGKYYDIIFDLAKLGKKSTSSVDAAAVLEHWQDEYLGRSLEAFLKEIRARERKTGKIYSKSFYIIQSSGFGKSRLIQQCGDTILTCSMVFRNPEARGTGYPPPDEEISEFLLVNEGLDRVKPHARAISFLLGIFETVYGYVNSFTLQGEELPKEWNKRMAPPKPQSVSQSGSQTYARSEDKIKFMADVIQSAQQTLSTVTNLILEKLGSPSGSAGKDLISDNAISDATKLVAERMLTTPMTKLVELIGTPRYNKELPRLLIAMDEVAALLEHNGGYSYSAFRRVLFNLRNFPFWVVFLSTSGQITTVAKPLHKESSLRISESLLIRPDPWLTFDVNLHEKKRIQFGLSDELLSPMNQYPTVSHLIGFGRPLWMIYAGKLYIKVRPFVVSKLLGGTADFNPNNILHVFSLLAFRVSLDPTLTDTQSVNLARESVDSHLRLLVSVDSSIGAMVTATPSEPLVSDAAAYLLNTKSATWNKCLSIMISKLFNRGRVVTGEKGELCARVLLVLARDKTVADYFGTKPDTEVVRSVVPISAKKLLQALLGDNFDKALESAAKKNSNLRMSNRTAKNKVDFDDFLNKAMVNFNHITTTSIPLQPSKMKSLLVTLLRRCAALQLFPQQEHWDLLIPIYLGDISLPLDLALVSAIVVQVKNRNKYASVFTSKEHQEFLHNAFEHYVYIHLKLGEKKKKEKKMPTKQNQKKKKSTKQRKEQEEMQEEMLWDSEIVNIDDSAIWKLIIYGHSHKSYPIIKHYGVANAVPR